MKKKIIILFVILLFMINIYSNTSGAFLSITQNALPASLGSAFVSVKNDINTLGFNPAGIAEIKSTEFLATYNRWIADISTQYMAYIQNMGDKGNLGVSLTFLSVTDIPGYDYDQNPIGSLNAYDGLLTVTWAKPMFIKNLMVGGSLKTIFSRLHTSNAFSVAVDIGGIYTYKLYDIGFSIRNAGMPLKYKKEYNMLPLSFTLGVSRKFLNEQLRVLFDIEQHTDKLPYINLGLSYSIRNLVDLRLGTKLSAGGFSQYPSLFTMGFGINIGGIYIDYAVQPFLNELGITHRLTGTIRFGAPVKLGEKIDKYRITEEARLNDYLNKSDAYAEDYDYRKALEYLDKAAAIFPENEEIRKKRYNIYSLLGNFEMAILYQPKEKEQEKKKSKDNDTMEVPEKHK